MDVFVINLDADTERRAYITGQLGRLGLPFEIVPGVLGSAISREERSRDYDDRRARWRLARSLVPAELGCALSHLAVYRHMVNRSVPLALVLEDDVILPVDLCQVLSDAERVVDVSRPCVCLLSPAQGKQTLAACPSLGNGHRLLSYWGGFYTSSYLLTLPAARALLRELYPVGDVADCWRRMHRYRVVDLFVVEPAVIVQNQRQFGSSTTSDYCAGMRTDAWSQVAYKLRRARCALFELVYAPYRRAFRAYPGAEGSSGG